MATHKSTIISLGLFISLTWQVCLIIPMAEWQKLQIHSAELAVMVKKNDIGTFLYFV